MSKITVTTIAGQTSGSDANTVKIESGDTLAVQTNATVGGTLGVTGASTVGGTLGVTGNTTIGGTAAITGNTTITGDLTVDTDTLKVDATNNRVMIGTTTEGEVNADNLTISDSGNIGMTLRSTNSGETAIYFSDATSGVGEYAGFINYKHADDSFRIGAGGADVLRCLNAISGSGYTSGSGSQLSSHPLVAIRATGFSRTDSYYDFTVVPNGGCYVIAGMSHDQQPSVYGKYANFQVAHSSTLVSVQTSEAYGSNGQLAVSKPNNTTLRITFNKNESSGSGSYFTEEFVAVFGSNPF